MTNASRWTRSVVGAICGCATMVAAGCILPYAWPKVACVRGYAPAELPADCRVFRMEATVDRRDISETLVDFSLSEQSRFLGGWLLPHEHLSVDYGLYVVGIALNYAIDRVHLTRLRLYRPGFELVEIDSWDALGILEWREENRLGSALDALVDPPIHWPRPQKGWAPSIDQLVAVLPPGSTSDGYKETLLFAAAEYERIARRADGNDEMTRFLAKAGALRELAAK